MDARPDVYYLGDIVNTDTGEVIKGKEPWYYNNPAPLPGFLPQPQPVMPLSDSLSQPVQPYTIGKGVLILVGIVVALFVFTKFMHR